MRQSKSKKKKIINDPVYGFIRIPSGLIEDIISHRWFQRLRNIKQLGLTDLVYPAARHSRFQHALGAMHLMMRVLDTLRAKGVVISDEEYEASVIAVLLHDMGHGPLSHALEETLLPGIPHETLSYKFMQELNRQFNGALELTLRIFRNSYHRKFFHQLVSSQLDIDRLDYLHRDCFFTGVPEGAIGVNRIVEVLGVHNDQLVVEEKGLYSIENFLHARRLMYWQVYLHKTTLSAERMVVNLIKRARLLARAGEKVPASDALLYFLKSELNSETFIQQPDFTEVYGCLDDNDIFGAIKLWNNHSDIILRTLSRMLSERRLFQIILQQEPIPKARIEQVRNGIIQQYKTLRADAAYLFSTGVVTNEAYAEGQKINILTAEGKPVDIAQASDLPTIKALTKIVKKNYLCWPKNVSL
ncbi:MAG: HD domain-containing protein [Cyclobacteriaceae bacterium]|nr:HD domain-containing protein [Cyclobacteriaceae bacterium]MCX7637436.1 HD domain-containing protein [Cyclobacteriaceae bacterium]